LLEECGVGDIFRIVDVHEHFNLPCGSHMVAKLEDPRAKRIRILTKPAQDKAFNPRELCGYKFMRIPGLGLRPFEFRFGPLLATNEVFSIFISRFSNYLVEHNITSLGLEYTIPEVFGKQTYETVSKKRRFMSQDEITTCSKLSNKLYWEPTAWACRSESKAMRGPEVWCGKDPDTGDHDPPKAKDMPANIHPMFGQFSLS
jgi:hypothetical protein